VKGASRVALIPARGGSKRLPRKNLATFFDKPIIAYSIEAAIKAGVFSKVVVSTEDDEIAQVGITLGAEVDFRDPSLSTDNATVAEVCVDYLVREEKEGVRYDILCVLYATAPLRNHTDVRNVVRMIKPGYCEYAMAVTQYDLPPQQALQVLPDGKLVPMWPSLVEKNSDQIPKLVVDNGSTYAVYVPSFLSTGSFHGAPLCGYEMPVERSVDINTQKDLELAAYYASRLVI
jgi:CMP-N-acetylneuraminic acid synthetase